MSKYKYFLLLFISILLNAKEPSLVFLDNIVSNEVQKYRIGQASFYCKPYGIVTIDKLYNNAAIDSTCKKSIEQFYLKKPDAKYFTLELLNVEQMYHVEFKNQECLVFVKGQRTLSELLLENGLAFERPHLKDKEYKYIFSKAQNKARFNKKGLWGNQLMRACILELYK